MRTPSIALALALAAVAQAAQAQQTMKPEETEVWTPVPKIITPGRTNADAPSDAIRLFDGKGLAEWVNAETLAPAGWTVANGVMTVNKKAGDIKTKRSFKNFQMHIEWRIPPGITGTGQGRGNSGVYLAATPEAGYELQILDSYRNTTYVNGQAGSVYKQAAPLANAMRKPGEWQVYDIVWTAPVFNADGTVKTPAQITAFHNGVLVQNAFVLKGSTEYIGHPRNIPYDRAPILLQSHGDPSAPISFRNIWVREL